MSQKKNSLKLYTLEYEGGMLYYYAKFLFCFVNCEYDITSDGFLKLMNITRKCSPEQF